MSKYNIAIVNSSSFGRVFPEHIQRLEEIGSVKHFTVDGEIKGRELAETLQGYNIIIASVTPFFTQEFFDHKDELILITRHGIGFNNVDTEAAKKHNTIVTIIPALVERDAVAENNVTNLMAILRKTVEAHQRVTEDRWEERAEFVGRTLFNKTVGVIGVGNTGSCVVEILRNGFRCNVLAYDPYKSELDIQSRGAKKVELEELLQSADIICLCANLTEENYHMIGDKEIAQMKEHVYISNSARGALLDEQAVVKGLKTGKIAGFATDVLEEEPGRKDHPYLAFDNVVMTPHTSAYTMECLEEMGKKCVRDVEDVAKGQLPERAVQPVSSYIK
ncbi:D-isomer specific 2-hydroxyacid dehydrogenase family protein [Enterococcus pallens]|uniref:4-phosphoerythronate dehydrogenase n=1 Tax=Enterococcus pallens ATCC BAA-351 TaxID=1158607 RepID=R2SY93_9ENTE|nr:D-isomer specific 2-hydroxyacid dehydrogenase family protein [Enterococcus pallens]EOH97751.1 4-phosphoerythronate dehydrogenase [Enterococcus pallens ATCC BAA-351]EOU20830.1 4-phosphoerythronate dehydrogenase [Enterococcus pallens ATCC BAA-351]OJG76171.1 4-phosphoerythronate dehydrogenase [Enterococcus pallens]